MKGIFISLIILCFGVMEWSQGESDVASKDDVKGYIYVSDAEKHKIIKFTLGGEFVLSFGKEGRGEGEFLGMIPDVGMCPLDMAIDSKGNVYIADFWNYRIQKFDQNGNSLKEFRFFKVGLPRSIAMDKEDCFYIGCLTKSGWQVQRLTKDGKFLMSFKKKEVRFEEYKGIAVDAQNNVYIVDSWNHCVHKFDQNGNFIMSFGEKQLYMPTAIAIFTFSEK